MPAGCGCGCGQVGERASQRDDDAYRIQHRTFPGCSRIPQDSVVHYYTVTGTSMYCWLTSTGWLRTRLRAGGYGCIESSKSEALVSWRASFMPAPQDPPNLLKQRPCARHLRQLSLKTPPSSHTPGIHASTSPQLYDSIVRAGLAIPPAPSRRLEQCSSLTFASIRRRVVALSNTTATTAPRPPTAS